MKTEDSNWKGPVSIGLPCTLPIKGDNGNTIAFSHCYSIPFQISALHIKSCHNEYFTTCFKK